MSILEQFRKTISPIKPEEGRGKEAATFYDKLHETIKDPRTLFDWAI